MTKHTKLLYSLSFLVILGVNPGACSKAMKGCGKASDDVVRGADDAAKGADNVGSQAVDDAARATAKEDPAATQFAADQAKKAEDASRSKSFSQNSKESYNYNNKQYNNFQDIPFQASDNIYLDRGLTSEEAAYLIKRGVKFVYNNSAYLKQKDKPFKVIYLISDDVNLVKNLYELDDANAKELINFSSKLPENESIIKVSSYEDMLTKEKEVLGNNEVPVLIFHNSVKQRTLNSFNPESNFITCNSFEVNAESYLTSIDLLDMRAIIEGINSSFSNLTLEDFYYKFTNTYHSYMAEHHQQNTLIFIGSMAGLSGGVYAIAYYNKKT